MSLVKRLSTLAAILFTFLNVMIFLCGSIDGSTGKENGCRSPKTHWSYVFPLYRFGCWMSEEIK
jgi:hypothetical protein